MAAMTKQLQSLDVRLSTFESAVNGRLAKLEEVTSTFGDKLVAMGTSMEMAGLHGVAIQELQDADLTMHNELQEVRDRCPNSCQRKHRRISKGFNRPMSR